MLNKESVTRNEEDIRLRVRKLPDDAKAHYYRFVNRQIKDHDTYAALNYTFFFGLHHLYLRRYARWFVQFALVVIAIVMLFYDSTLLAGLFILAGVALFELYELFRSEVIVQDYNNAIMKEALRTFRGRRGSYPA